MRGTSPTAEFLKKVLYFFLAVLILRAATLMAGYDRFQIPFVDDVLFGILALLRGISRWGERLIAISF